jgi:carbonic anhydrase
MNKICFLLLCGLSQGFSVTPSEALQKLKEGNQRYAQGMPLYANHSADRRTSLQQGQAPFATIVSCSDSRVIPEIIFDQGLGDIFVVRIAGNVVGPIELDSIDFSVKILGSSLIVVLGHESCGAVKAVVDKNTQDIEQVAALIQPAVKNIKDLETAVKANVQYFVSKIPQSSFLQKQIADKKLACIGGYYSLATGKVELIGLLP